MKSGVSLQAILFVLSACMLDGGQLFRQFLVAMNDAPMLPSPLRLRVGDSIGEVRRCFRGQIDEFRVWRKALTDFDLGLSPEEKLEAFARAMRIQVRWASPSEPVSDGTATWGFALDELSAASIPDAVQEIIVVMEAEDWRDGDDWLIAADPKNEGRKEKWSISIEVPQRSDKYEPPFAQPVFADDVLADGPSGKYRFLATMLQGGAPQGGEAKFYVSDPAEMPAVTHEIMLWGEDAELGKWLAACDISARPFVLEQPTVREVSRAFTQEEVTTELDRPDEAVCGTNRLSANYASGLHVAVYRLGAGHFILNNLLVRENLGQVPAAERLLRNMLIYAGREADKPLAELPADSAAHLQAIGYSPQPDSQHNDDR